MNPPGGLKNNSQAVKNLSKMFRSLDLDGSGKLDKASFQTAMYSVDIVDNMKIEEMFNVMNTKKDGYINYEEFLSSLRAGDLKKTGVEIMENANLKLQHQNSENSSEANTPGGYSCYGVAKRPSVNVPSAIISPRRKGKISRAVAVIKKSSARRSITKDEVVWFLRNKGLCNKDIVQAFQWAEKEAKNPEEKEDHLKGLLASKKIELDESTHWCKEISSTIRLKKAQLKKLRSACLRAFESLHVTHGEAELDSDLGEEGAVPGEVLKEIRSKVKKMKKNNEIMAGKGLFDEDLKRLQQMEECLLSGQSFCCYLLLVSLEPNLQNSLVQTHRFLSEWET